MMMTDLIQKTALRWRQADVRALSRTKHNVCVHGQGSCFKVGIRTYSNVQVNHTYHVGLAVFQVVADDVVCPVHVGGHQGQHLDLTWALTLSELFKIFSNRTRILCAACKGPLDHKARGALTLTV